MISNDGSSVYQILSPRVMSTIAGYWVFVAARYGTSGTDNIAIFVRIVIINGKRTASAQLVQRLSQWKTIMPNQIKKELGI